MSIDNVNVVDFISTKDELNEVYLTISDHLDWKHIEDHLLILQEKLNAYAGFIESGDLYNQYPLSIGKKIIINVVGKYDAPKGAIDFYDQANIVLSQLNTIVRFSYYASPDL